MRVLIGDLKVQQSTGLFNLKSSFYNLKFPGG